VIQTWAPSGRGACHKLFTVTGKKRPKLYFVHNFHKFKYIVVTSCKAKAKAKQEM